MPLEKISERPPGLRAAVFDGPGRLVVRERAVTLPSTGEVLLRVRACGICGSDLNIFHCDPPVPRFWAGHEIGGVVEELGEGVRGIKRGAGVVVSPLVPCGSCHACASGRANLCKKGSFVSFDRPGGFAEFVTVPSSNVFELPTNLDPEEAVLVEPLGAALHAVSMGGPVARKRALVIGCGTLGLLITRALSIIGASMVSVLGKYPFQREIALKMGADEALDPAGCGPLSHHKPFDIVFDTSGGFGSASITTAIEALLPGGVLVLSGVHYRTPEMNLKDLTEKEIEVRGAQRYSREDFVRALGLFAEGRARARGLITHRVALEDIMEGFSIASHKEASGAVKVIVCP